MWLSISIFVALVILAIFAYLYAAQKDKPVTEQERYMLVYEDGLLELCGGLYLIVAGAMFDVSPGLMGIFVPLLYVVLLSAKTAITKPRLDPAMLPGEVAKQRQMKMILLLGLGLVVGMAAFLLIALRGWLIPTLTPVLILITTGLLTLWAYRTGIRRLYLYAILLLAIYGSSFWLAVTFSIYLMVMGLGMALIGASETLRFVQEHPKLLANGR